MRYFYFTFIFILFICCGANKRYLKPYDPEKAGATIVESFDITKQLRLVRYSGDHTTSLDDASYEVAEYNNDIYIRNREFIHVYKKATFSKSDEIRLVEIKHRGNGFVITDDGKAFLFNASEKYLYSVDLITGDSVLLDDFEIKDGVNFNDINCQRMGYDMADNLIWFESSQRNYYFFKYNPVDGFIFFEKKNGINFRPVRNTCVIYGNVIFLSGHSYIGGNTIGDVGIWIYHLDNPEKIEHFIDVEYLNTLTIPQSAHYDGEHIWLLVERKGRILMLKLLPHW